jgi:cytochrome c
MQHVVSIFQEAINSAWRMFMKYLATAAALFALTLPAFAEGDAEAGEKTFKKCKSCHGITDAEGEKIVKGGRTGPNLFGIIGRAAGSVEDFKYSKSMIAAGEAGLVWDEALLAEFVQNPKAFLAAELDDSKAKSKMTYKLKKGGEDVAAYLGTFSPAVEETEGTEESSDS